MEDRRGTRESAVRREDPPTRAPRRRRVAVASALAALSVVGGAGIFTTLDDFGRGVGTEPEAHGPVGAEAGAVGGGALPAPGLVPDNPGEAPPLLVNGTQAAPSPQPQPS